MKCLMPALALFLALPFATTSTAQRELNDLEMAHVAVTASHVDIAYAHLALALSETPAIREFAETMIRDHSAVNGQVAALAAKLNVVAQDNAVSRKLLTDSRGILDQLSRLRGPAFDAFYARNELAYHRQVNGLVANTFIPNLRNPEVRGAFERALVLFRGHERHAEQLAARMSDGMGGR